MGNEKTPVGYAIEIGEIVNKLHDGDLTIEAVRLGIARLFEEYGAAERGRATEEERERCASIADEWTNSPSCCREQGACEHIRTAASIAERIRAKIHCLACGRYFADDHSYLMAGCANNNSHCE